MKFLSAALFLFLLSSCSTPEKLPDYDPAKNCSPRGLSKMLESSNIPPTADRLKELGKLRTEIRNAGPDLRECYQNALDNRSVNQGHVVCIVMETSDIGGLIFLDIEDNVNPISADLRKCMIDVFAKVSFKGIKKAIISQPLNLHLRRN